MKATHRSLRYRSTIALMAGAVCLSSTLADAAKNDVPVPWPTTRTRPPSKADWESALPISARVYGEKARACEMRQHDEWLYVRCPKLKTSAITLLGGTRSELSYFIEPAGADRVPGAGQVVFPLRPGERRVLSFWTLGPGYDGPLTVVPAIVLQTTWLKDGLNPTITLTDALHEPVATKTHPRAPQAKER